MKVAYLGPQASYTHQAAIKAFGHRVPAPELAARATIQDVFTAAQNGDVDLAVVPFENSTNGSVVPTLDLFIDQGGKSTDVVVVDEIYLPVSHSLLGRREASGDTVGNGTELSRINKLYTHPQAWGQCKRFLSTYLSGAERQDVSSTARAAEIVAQEHSTTSAAISSKLAAEINGLDILAEGIEDNSDNTTRFFVLRRAAHLAASSDDGSGPMYKTMVSFTVDHAAPGALADALAVFRAHDLNLTSINTRPSGQGNWMYEFFVEFKGHRDDEPVKAALQELKRGTKTYRWLGSWTDALKARC